MTAAAGAGRQPGLRRPSFTLLAAALTLALGGCAGLPRSGPTTGELESADEATGRLEGLVAPLTPEALSLIPLVSPRGFPAAFAASGPIDPQVIRPNDMIEVTVWEGESEGEGTGLLGGGGGPARLGATPVDDSGRIYVPFIGAVRAAGLTPAQLRARIADALSQLVLSPQVDVRLAEPAGRLVTVQGSIGRPGAYPIDATALRLSPLLAVAGGSTLPPEQVEVIVQRGEDRGAEVLEDVFADPRLDLALRPGDSILLTPLRERFVVLGAVGAPSERSFPVRELSLMSAIGLAGGLRDFDADPTGVFVFRRENEAVADALLPGPPPEGLPDGQGRPIVYRLDLTEPGAMFLASQFRMRDGDAIFVTNAPLTEVRKLIQVFTSALVPVQQTGAIAAQ